MYNSTAQHSTSASRGGVQSRGMGEVNKAADFATSAQNDKGSAGSDCVKIPQRPVSAKPLKVLDSLEVMTEETLRETLRELIAKWDRLERMDVHREAWKFALNGGDPQTTTGGKLSKLLAIPRNYTLKKREIVEVKASLKSNPPQLFGCDPRTQSFDEATKGAMAFNIANIHLNAPLDTNIPLKFIDDESELYSFSEELLLKSAEDRAPVVFSIGIGFCTGFDQTMIFNYGAKVYGFDPTPQVAKYVEGCRASGELPEEYFIFTPCAIGGSDEAAVFNFPKSEEAFNGALADAHLTAAEKDSAEAFDSVEVQVKTIATAARELGVDKIDLIQMDIEGGEFDALDALEKSDIRPAQLAIEFHYGLIDNGYQKFYRAVDQLHSMGYALVDKRRRDNFKFGEQLWVLRSELSSLTQT